VYKNTAFYRFLNYCIYYFFY